MGILGGLIITAIAYMAVPMIMLASNGGKFPKKKANKIALWNSVVVGIIFLIITISLEATAGWTPLPAFLYYWINSAIIMEKGAKTKGITNNNEGSIVQETNITKINIETNTSGYVNNEPIIKPKVEEISNINFCRKCGNKLIDGSVFCNKCGSKVN